MRTRLLTTAFLATALLLAQPGTVVTQALKIRMDGREQSVRQINGRWFSPDNRELYQTGEKWSWTIEGGNAWNLVRFDHHRPVDPQLVARVDRSMGPEQVKTILGPANSVFPKDRPEQQQTWDYYGPNGYKLSIQFAAANPGILTASYEPDAKSPSQDVRHLASRFKGKSAQESFQEEKLERAKLAAGVRPGKTAATRTAPVRTAVNAAPSRPTVPARKLTAQELQSVSIGMPRAKLVELLGQPRSRSTISGGDGTRETLRYVTESGSTAAIVLIDGKVTELPR
ncbi:MAG: hypothetical protein ABI995_04145 [Acidobacteriota bacterium]